MANNSIVDVSEINSWIQKMITLEATVKAETSVHNGNPTSPSTTKHFTHTYSMRSGRWNHHKVDGKYVKTLHVSFSSGLFTSPPTVQLTIEGNHPHLTVHVSNVTHSGCDINVVKTNGRDFGQHQSNHSVHLVATGR
jgi:hypothetical protein